MRKTFECITLVKRLKHILYCSIKSSLHLSIPAMPDRGNDSHSLTHRITHIKMMTKKGPPEV